MLHIFTIVSDEDRLLYLKLTEKNYRNNVNYIILDKWNGYPDKITSMKKCINNIQSDDIVCFIDGYDVLINSNNEDIINKFKSYNCNILLGAELNCFPPDYKEKMDKINNNEINFYKYINSGGYIGYSKNIKDMLYWKSENEIIEICKNGGDQTYIIEYYLNNIENINLDIYCKVFQNMHLVSWKEIIFNYGVVHNTVMNINPCFIHFNGGTWQTNKLKNIMPVFVEKIEKSKFNNFILNLDDYNQIITSTCYPHKQK